MINFEKYNACPYRMGKRTKCGPLLCFLLRLEYEGFLLFIILSSTKLCFSMFQTQFQVFTPLMIQNLDRKTCFDVDDYVKKKQEKNYSGGRGAGHQGTPSIKGEPGKWKTTIMIIFHLGPNVYIISATFDAVRRRKLKNFKRATLIRGTWSKLASLLYSMYSMTSLVSYYLEDLSLMWRLWLKLAIKIEQGSRGRTWTQ